MTPVHVMVDVETLDTTPRAVVLSIGAVAFFPNRPEGEFGDTFYAELTHTVDHQFVRGRTASASTIAWWIQQEGKAKDLFRHVNELQRPPIRAYLLDFADYLISQGKFEDTRVWGNGAAMDNVILHSLFTDYEITPPWAFYNDRCFRTLKNMAKGLGIEPPKFEGVKHNAVDDARHQARHVQRIYKELEKKWTDPQSSASPDAPGVAKTLLQTF